MVMLHLMEDILGWVAVLIVSVILYFKPWFILDSILSIIVSLLVLKGVYQGLKKVVTILMQAFPVGLSMENVKSELTKVKDVLDVHYIQGWSMDEEFHSLTFHVIVPDEKTVKELDAMKITIKSLLFDMKISEQN
jgi:cobalt-zinc-cadmium efflux system protein